jgi:Ca2+-binding EF-hand superfamily protein
MGNNSNETWESVIKEFDANGDGEISYDEFLKIIDIILKT